MKTDPAFKKNLPWRCLLLLFCVIGILLALTACSNRKQKYRTLPVTEEDTVFALIGDIQCCAYGDSGIFYLKTGKSAVYAMSLTGGEEHIIVEDAGTPVLIAADGESVCVYEKDTHSLIVFREDGSDQRRVTPIFSDVPPEIHTMDCRGNEVVLCSQDRMWLIDLADSSAEEVDLRTFVFSEITASVFTSKGNILFVGKGGEGAFRNYLYETDRKGRMIGNYPVAEYNYGLCEYGGDVYYCDKGKLAKVSENQVQYLQKIQSYTSDGVGMPSALCVTDKSVSIFWKHGKDSTVVLSPMIDPDTFLHMLAPSSFAFDADMLGERCGVALMVTEIDDQAFLDVLSSKILAGDRDFDLVYAGPVGNLDTLFYSVARHGRFADLYANEQLRTNINEMFPGINRMIEYHGKAVALPLAMPYEIYPSSETSLKTQEDLWALCDTLLGEGAGRSVFPNRYPGAMATLLRRMIEGHLLNVSDPASEEIPTDALQETEVFLTKAEKYIRSGVLFGENAMIPDIYRGSFPFGIVLTYLKQSSDYVIPPVMEEGDPLPVSFNRFLYVNSESPRIDASLVFLAKVSDREMRYDTLVFRSPFWPDLSAYHQNELNDNQKEIPDEAAEVREQLEEYLEAFYANCRISWLEETSAAADALSKFCQGNLGSEETAQALYDSFVYSVKG